MPSESSAATISVAVYRDGIADILDLVEGWTRPMTSEEKLEAIAAVANRLWEADRAE